jgi:hypothetical protein
MNNIGESINNITAILSIVSSHPYRTKNERYPQNEKTLFFLQDRKDSVFYGIGKYMLLYSDKVTYTFPPYRKREKTREACAKRYFFLVERVARRERKTGNCLHP